MTDEKKIEQESSGKEIAEHFPEDAYAPKQQETKPATSNQQPATNMEIHKHPHHVTHKKKWGEYALEFLMLFLAVFLGFLAENQRENMVEHHREIELAKQLYSELSDDSIVAANKIKSRQEKEMDMNYLVG